MTSVIRPARPAGRRAHQPAAARLTVAGAALAGAALAAACSDNTNEPRPPKLGVAVDARVGDTVLLNVRVPGGAALDNVGPGSGGCDAPNLVKGRIAAVSDRAVVVVDTRNPASGVNDAVYTSIAQAFDSIVWPVDTRHFGTPADIDNNGKVVAFYTRAVNGLTEANSESYVGGFFYSRDLFPTTNKTVTTGNGSSTFEGCAGSNASEMFYLLAPDPTGAVNGNKFDTAFVRRVTVGTIAHEFQHLISASRRLYILNANSYDEEVWLNEGMSHIAEELNFFQAAGLSPSLEPGQSPRSRVAYANFRNNAKLLNALNAFEFQNFGRLSYYLGADANGAHPTETYSPYSSNDDLETRGATYSFLRYLLDRAGTKDSALTYALVNSPDTGLVNLTNVLARSGGALTSVPLATIFRDWAVSTYADSASSAVFNTLAKEYTQPSWVFRSVLTKFTFSDGTTFNNGVYPLATRTLAGGVAQTVNLAGGGASYFVFAVPAGGTATLTATSGGGALPNTVRLAAVRTTGTGAGTVTTVDGTGSGPGTVTIANTGTGTIQGALVVFNADQPATASHAVTVTATGITAPLASEATYAGVALSRAAGPTRARLAAALAGAAAGGRDPIMSDAAVMRRLQVASRSELLPRVAAARAAYQSARRSGDFSAWSRQAYVPGSVRGSTVPVGAGAPAMVRIGGGATP